MAHVGRTVKNLEAPRPLKSQSRTQMKNNYILIEELILLLENVALSLASGVNNAEPMATLVQNLRIHGPQLESVSKDTLDRAFVVFRNASQDERLNIMTRLNLLELIELRAKGWEDNGFNSYYKSKATNVDLPDGIVAVQMHHVDASQSTYLSTSPTFVAGAVAATAAGNSGSLHHLQQQQMLAPGEIIRNSGKFPKPTKIPGKTYCKDEVVIRNADSGKVMGIKGRRVHMIEELSETIISFQRVNPGAKERLVQITGPAEDKINYAKQLMEDTIRRNASPVRLEHPQLGGAQSGAGGSCSSLASSASDETQPRSGAHGMLNRLSLNSTIAANNYMTPPGVVLGGGVGNHQSNSSLLNSSTPISSMTSGTGKMLRSANQQMLLHSYSTNDASLGEYKYTVNVGQHVIKITGDCCDLVRVAKLVLDDYFSSNEFLASVEAGSAFDGSIVSPISTPSTPMGTPQFIMGTPLQMAPPLADSGIGLNYMSGQITEGDDDVFVNANGIATPSSNSQNNNGLARSRRSHFSRKDSVSDPASASGRKKSESASGNNTTQARIVHEYEHLLFYSRSPHSWALPADWQTICDKYPTIVRNKVMQQSSCYNNPIAPNTTGASQCLITANNIHNITTTFATSTNTTTATVANSNGVNIIYEDTNPFQVNIKRKGFFNRGTYSIDEETGFSTHHSNHIQHNDANYNSNNNNNSNNISCNNSYNNNNNNNKNNYNNNHNNNNNYNNNNNNNNNNNYNHNNHNNHSNNSQEENLLKKQIKMIEAITESGGGIGIGGGGAERKPFKDDFDIDDTDENIDVLTNAVSSLLKTKFSMEFPFRSNSTCN